MDFCNWNLFEDDFFRSFNRFVLQITAMESLIFSVAALSGLLRTAPQHTHGR